MTLAGWIFMIVSWTVILGLFAFFDLRFGPFYGGVVDAENTGRDKAGGDNRQGTVA